LYCVMKRAARRLNRRAASPPNELFLLLALWQRDVAGFDHDLLASRSADPVQVLGDTLWFIRRRVHEHRPGDRVGMVQCRFDAGSLPDSTIAGLLALQPPAPARRRFEFEQHWLFCCLGIQYGGVFYYQH